MLQLLVAAGLVALVLLASSLAGIAEEQTSVPPSPSPSLLLQELASLRSLLAAQRAAGARQEELLAELRAQLAKGKASPSLPSLNSSRWPQARGEGRGGQGEGRGVGTQGHGRALMETLAAISEAERHAFEKVRAPKASVLGWSVWR